MSDDGYGSAPQAEAYLREGGNIQWGYRMRHVGGPHGKHARASEYVADDRADAEECVAHLLKTPENWEAEVLWRTAAVEPGPWQAVKAVPEPAGEQGEETPLQVVADLISLAGLSVPQEVIATWTRGEREVAAAWAASEHLTASDNTGIARRAVPPYVARASEICASPAQAQLALEAWARCKEDLVHAPAGSSVPDRLDATARAAQDAITGLLSLLGGGERLFTAEQMQASYDNGYVTAREHAATEEPLS